MVITEQALSVAYDQGLDLVEVSPDANPPVCKIMDYGKFKFEQSKKLKEVKKKQHTPQLKEMKFRPKTDIHDFEFKVANIKKFLLKGDRVKVFVVFKGREMAYLDFGRELLGRVHEELKDIACDEYTCKLEGRNMTSMYYQDRSKVK